MDALLSDCGFGPLAIVRPSPQPLSLAVFKTGEDVHPVSHENHVQNVPHLHGFF